MDQEELDTYFKLIHRLGLDSDPEDKSELVYQILALKLKHQAELEKNDELKQTLENLNHESSKMAELESEIDRQIDMLNE